LISFLLGLGVVGVVSVLLVVIYRLASEDERERETLQLLFFS